MYIKQRVVKSCSVEITAPVVFSCESEKFERLYKKLPKLSLLPTKIELEEEPEEIQSEIACTLTKDVEDFTLLIEDARIEAENIVKDAQSTAQSIIEEALLEAEKIKLEAQENVLKLQEEIAEGVRQEILPKANNEASVIINEAKSIFNLAQQTLAGEIARVDERILTLIIGIAERIARTTLSIRPEYLLDIIRSLAEGFQDKEDMCLHISSQDADIILRIADESLFPCPWVRDDTLGQGDIYIEHRHGVLDARISTQLEKIELILREELMNGKVEQVNQ